MKTPFGTVLIVGCLMPLIALSANALTLVEAGQSDYVIAICEGAIASEQTAASELQHFLEAVSGARLPILPAEEAGAKALFVGPGKHFQAAFPEIDLSALGHDGIVLQSRGDAIYLAGGRPRGTLYAVYTFLETQIGCRWWTATESFIPERPTLEVPPLKQVYTPKLQYREAFYRNALADGVFTARLKCNGHFSRTSPEYGNHYSIIGWCHTFNQFLPPEKYFDEHPEWYSEINGKRTAQHAQLCLSNSEMRDAFIQVVLERIAAQPEAGIISVSQNDCHGPCQCAACRALAEAEGSEAGPLIHFVNQVAEVVEKQYPDVLIETLAYQYTRQAPKTIRPRGNVIVRLCSIECCFSQPLASGAQNESFKKDIADWSAIAQQLYIWNYVTNFRHYILPHPNMRVLAPNLRHFVDHKAIGLFEQGDSMCAISDFPELRPWVLAHLMWNPDQDINTLIDTFLGGYYGPAATPLRAYIELIHDAVEASGCCLRCYMEDTSGWFTVEQLQEAIRLFEAAEAAVAGDPDHLRRVQRARMPLRHVLLKERARLVLEAEAAGLPVPGPPDLKAECAQFIADATAFDAAFYAEGRPFAPYAERLARLFRDPAPAPTACAGLDPGQWIDIQDNLFHYHGEGRLSAMVEDPAASDGMAARMPGNHTEWAVQYPITASLAERGNLALTAMLRLALKDSSTAPLCSLGLYDAEAKRSLSVQQLHSTDLDPEGYTPIALGSFDLTPGVYLWVAPANNPAVEGVYIDRFYAVAEE